MTWIVVLSTVIAVVNKEIVSSCCVLLLVNMTSVLIHFTYPECRLILISFLSLVILRLTV